MKKLISILVVTILILTGCKGEENNGKPNIVTTVFPVTEMVKVVAGEDANISSIYPSGADVHNYELTSKDMAKIADSDLFFYISDSNEPFVHALEESGKYKTKFINISEHELFKNKVDKSLYGISDDHTHDNDSEHVDGDEIVLLYPHIWLSPKKLLLMLDVSNYETLEGKEIALDSVIKLRNELIKLDKEYINFGKNQKYPICQLLKL